MFDIISFLRPPEFQRRRLAIFDERSNLLDHIFSFFVLKRKRHFVGQNGLVSSFYYISFFIVEVKLQPANRLCKLFAQHHHTRSLALEIYDIII